METKAIALCTGLIGISIGIVAAAQVHAAEPASEADRTIAAGEPGAGRQPSPQLESRLSPFLRSLSELPQDEWTRTAIGAQRLNAPGGAGRTDEAPRSRGTHERKASVAP